MNAIGLYMREVCSRPLLTREEEADLARRYAETKDPKAARRLVEGNLRFVVKIALEYTHGGSRLADLIQEGNIGLIRSLEEFDPSYGVRLATYAVFWIRGAIVKFLAANAQQEATDPDKISAEDDLRHPPEEAAPADEQPSAIVENSQVRARVKALVEHFEETLPARDRDIFRSLWRTERRSPLRDLSRRHCITDARVCQLETQILGRLRKFLQDQMGDELEAA